MKKGCAPECFYFCGVMYATDEKKPPLVTEVLSTEEAAYLLRILFCPDGVSVES